MKESILCGLTLPEHISCDTNWYQDWLPYNIEDFFINYRHCWRCKKKKSQINIKMHFKVLLFFLLKFRTKSFLSVFHALWHWPLRLHKDRLSRHSVLSLLRQSLSTGHSPLFTKSRLLVYLYCLWMSPLALMGAGSFLFYFSNVYLEFWKWSCSPFKTLVF